ncbi:Dehydrogenase/reductase SDR family member 11 [Oopsacas minuta]|uniref:Dehydrogenase/reductase SDR family member 11 n=1 Tax=Oopsacas minuta TaxID=111878 RepID=A0AAV7JRD1_9METZ|nr:Dehydrogenase/reductase SDR family member 11 [Oopsacas minuta]
MATSQLIQISKEWIGKVALVTGASAGIGLQLLKSLTNSGIRCVGCARNISKIEELSNGVIAHRCDVSNDTEVKFMFEMLREKLGGVDILINNAGLSHYSPLLTGSTEEWREMLQVNILGLSICTREFLQQLKSRLVETGYVVNLCSMSGHRVLTDPNYHFYAATKYAVTALTEGLRQELRATGSGVKVSQISPGLVDTEFKGRAMKDMTAAKVYYESNPVLTCEDISQSVLYLLSTPQHVSVHDILMRPTRELK